MNTLRSRLSFETLEAREVPAVITAINISGIVHVYVDNSGGTYTLTRNDDTLCITQNGKTVEAPQLGFGLQGVVFNGGSGNDIVKNQAYVKSSIYGNGGNDILYGGYFNDNLFGGSGNDELHGGNANDNIYGGTGTDVLRGESGSDFLDDGSLNDSEDNDGGAGQDFWAHRIVYNGTLATDIDQNQTPTCWVLAPIAAAAKAGINFANRITYLGGGVYRVKLLEENGGYHYQHVKLAGGVYSFEPSVKDSESWVLLVHRAIMQEKGVDWANKDAYSGGFPSHIMALLTGRSVASYGNEITGGGFATGNNQAMKEMQQFLAAGKIICPMTRQGGYGSYHILGSVSTPKLVAAHVYAVDSIDIANKKITLRNPWGVDGGSASGITDDGLVTITFQQFYDSMWSYAVS